MRVLVAIDSSGYADEILDQVALRSWPQGSEFSVVTTIEPCPVWEAAQEFHHQAKIILVNRVESLKKRLPQCTINGQVLDGSAATVITDIAGEWHADLVVLGSHGDTGTRKKGIGSIAAAVVNDAPCSVEVVKLRKGSERNRSKGVTAAGNCH